MNLMPISQRFPDQQACIQYLQEKRWGQHPCCPHCDSQRVGRKQEGKRSGRWNCHGCKSSCNVFSGTILERTMVPLPKWLLAIGWMVGKERKTPEKPWKILSDHHGPPSLPTHQP